MGQTRLEILCRFSYLCWNRPYDESTTSSGDVSLVLNQTPDRAAEMLEAKALSQVKRRPE